MGRAGERQGAGAVVGRVGAAQVQAGVAESDRVRVRGRAMALRGPPERRDCRSGASGVLTPGAQQLVVARDPESSRGGAAVDGERGHPAGVLVEQQLAGRDVGEGGGVARADGVRRASSTRERLAEPQAGAG